MKYEQLGVSVGIGGLLLAIFMVDTRMALGFTPWLLYVIPLGLTYWVSMRYAPLLVAGLCTLLIIADYGMSAPLASESLALTNRAIGIGTFWVLAWLITSYQRLLQRQSAVTARLRDELMERTQDLGRAVSALRAAGRQGSERTDDQPVAAQELTRRMTDVLEAEHRRLEEKVSLLVRREPASEPADSNLDSTLEELERLGKQLAEWQRHLLRP